jgi:phosphoglucosamine mutase
MTLSFGTDGIRGDAESEFTDDFVRALGFAAARALGSDHFVIGRDTRASGERIEAALAAGIAAAGVRVDLVGVVPTPGVAFLAADDDTAGAMISASHNPWSDNGVKLFAPGGRKLTDDIETALEDDLAALRNAPDSVPAAVDGDLVLHRPELVAAYRSHLLDTVEASFDGLRVVLDCANGAASTLAPDVFRELGAIVEVLHADPDGRNINDACGSTHPDDLQTVIQDRAADIGLAFDGDADRVVAVDERGGLVDGDHIIGMCAIDRRDRGVLVDDTVVVTVLSNLGFRRGMALTGINVIETPVGDRHVLEVLDRNGLNLGGEQSGHVIFRDLATTGDGILTGLQVCDLLMRTGAFVSDLAATAMTRYPQVARNVPVSGSAETIVEQLAGAIAAEEQRLGGDGRILVRASGTEPLVRVMVESSSGAQAQAVAERLVAEAQRLAG